MVGLFPPLGDFTFDVSFVIDFIVFSSTGSEGFCLLSKACYEEGGGGRI